MPARSPAASPARPSAATATRSSAASSARSSAASIGNAVERGATRENAVEILVQLSNGERRAIVQGAGGEAFAPGDPVVLVTTGGRTRISRAPQRLAPATRRRRVPGTGDLSGAGGYPNAPVQPVYPPSGPVPPRS